MIIVIQCRDQVGLVAAISALMAKHQYNIISLGEHVDVAENLFFMRLEVEAHVENPGLHQELLNILPAGAVVKINPQPEKKIVVLVTKEYHCLADILVRNYFGTLGAAVQCVIGNYNILEDVCRRFDVPFHHAPYDTQTKEQAEAQISSIIKQNNPDYIVLAKFMRILSPQFNHDFATRIINIHHSFLPAFVGANPYRQAFERGVKLIGATAHFVSDELDEGPIIAQQIIPVNHGFTAADMMNVGREVETAVLAKALKLVFDDRVFVYNNKTVVIE
ncbi:formyltetrahydrofolate deformylase [Mucilaginibacter limnophilus]|uniref:Formyltetrahydrofolate deformylase n=1 Tax=Mucilaginibacter limnophilus TaxID=1932778 RepID=A0A437MVE5_9SPHI|nr:formyltetrahydrofolate deformylase [Mucilaginibacter limnophilus]RVU01642.1 formyltetrahydrofolate deformylase [Mucilaginibacter limnophilus]